MTVALLVLAAQPAAAQRGLDVLERAISLGLQLERQQRRQPAPPAPHIQPVPVQPVQIQGQSADPTREATREVQALLNARGYDAGPTDGMWGPRTRAALIAFQRAAGLVPDGRTGPATLTALRGSGIVEPATATPATAPAGDGIAGLYCAPFGTLAIREVGPGTVEFDLAAWSGGYSCGHGGTAVRQGSAWRHRSNEYGSACGIDLIAGDGVTLSTAAGAPCTASCGAGMSMDGLHFPARSRVAATSDATIASIYGGNDPCDAYR